MNNKKILMNLTQVLNNVVLNQIQEERLHPSIDDADLVRFNSARLEVQLLRILIVYRTT